MAGTEMRAYPKILLETTRTRVFALYQRIIISTIQYGALEIYNTMT